MIHHVVMWRLREDAKRGGRIDGLERIRECLAAMRTAIPGVIRLELGVNESGSADAADLGLLAEFASRQALLGYERHRLHDELRALIGPIRVERRVVDCEA